VARDMIRSLTAYFSGRAAETTPRTNPKSDGSKSTLVTVRIFVNDLEAHLAKAALETKGINCRIGRYDCGGLRASLSMSNGIRRIVRSEDADRAHKILATKDDNGN
jgi:hypothetical protein